MQVRGQEATVGGVATRMALEMAIGRAVGRTTKGGNGRAAVGRCRATAIAEAVGQGRCSISSARPTCPIRMRAAGRREGLRHAPEQAEGRPESGQTSS